jgi:hypothetical protein
MPYILDFSCSRKSLSSTVEQQDDAGGGEDSVLSSNTRMPYPPHVETRRQMVQTATKANPGKSSQISVTLILFQ